MDAVFGRVLQISLSGSIIVLAVLILRLMLKNAPKRTVCLLWMLAVLRLLMPFEIQSNWSMQPPPPEFAPIVQPEYFDSTAYPQPQPPELLEEPVEYPLQPLPEPEKETSPMAIGAWVWLTGMGVLMLHGAASYLRLKRRVRDDIIFEEGVWLCPGLDSAFVLGFFRPRIYLPVLSSEERELVLLHERCHIRRLDHWWKLLAYAAVSIHWFNPLAWMTYILLCRDMELACDQETVKGMDNAMRKAYSAALLNCAAKRSGIAACPVAFGEISVKERIKMVLHYRKPGFWVTLIALIAAIAVGFFLLTSPRTDLERCEGALKQWQKMDAYKFRETQANSGDGALNDFYTATYWSVDGAHLKQFFYGEDLGHWNQWKDGEGYFYEFGSEDAEWVDEGWVKVELQEEETIPWVTELDFDALKIHHVEPAEDGKTVLVTAEHPSLGTINLTFSFDEDGALWSISRSFTSHFTVNENETVSVVASSIVALEETDRGKIQEEMDRFGVKPELLQLYRELDALQGAECVHLVTNMEKDNVYHGWDNQRQEFLKWGSNRFYDFEMRSEFGEIDTRHLWYGGKAFDWAHSNTDGAPQHPWMEVERDPVQPELLTMDWRALEVLDIRQEGGSAVITLQGELTQEESCTYRSRTYEFHLNRDGKLTTVVADYHYGEFVEGVGDVETRGTNTTVIQDTSNAEIQQRITDIWEDVIQEIRTIGVPEELLQLYRELEALQNAENVHLVIDMELDSDYPGWQTCRQEFLRTGNQFYRNFDYQSQAGPYTTSYLNYGSGTYAREYSDAGVVPNRDWERIQDGAAGEIPLLNLDWTRFELLEIEHREDGSTAITLQGNLNSTKDTTYYEKTYEFHLDPDGKLTTQICSYHASRDISDGFAQGTFEFRGRDTVYIQNTPKTELTRRILEVTKELLEYEVNGSQSGD